MNPVDLVARVIALACGACGLVYNTAAAAVACCAPKTCADCGTEVRDRPFWHHCEPCREKRKISDERSRFDAAEKISEADYTGWVYHDECGPQEGYFSSVDDLREWCADESTPPPDYVYACDEHGAPTLNAEDIIASEFESAEMHEDAIDSVVGVTDLQAAMDAWHAKQTVTSYMVDHARVVVLEPDPAPASAEPAQ